MTGSTSTLIDKSDAFVFGFSKLDVMFGRADAGRGPACRTATSSSRACGSCSETVTAIDPEAAAGDHRRRDVYEADVLVVALGADYDLDATPGLAEGGQRVLLRRRGRARCRDHAGVRQGHAVIGGLRHAVQVPAGAERDRAAARTIT